MGGPIPDAVWEDVVACDECEAIFVPVNSIWAPPSVQTYCFEVEEGPLQGHYHACSPACQAAVKRAIEELERRNG